VKRENDFFFSFLFPNKVVILEKKRERNIMCIYNIKDKRETGDGSERGGLKIARGPSV